MPYDVCGLVREYHGDAEAAMRRSVGRARAKKREMWRGKHAIVNDDVWLMFAIERHIEELESFIEDRGDEHRVLGNQ